MAGQVSNFNEILTSLGYPIRDYGDYWRMPALYRGGDNPLSLSVDKRTGHFHDFKSHASGDFSQLVKLIDGTIKIESLNLTESEPALPKIKRKIYYPKEILKRLLPHYDFYLNRGISKETLETFEAGMAHSGKLNRRIVFPIYDRENRIIGFAGRWYQEKPPYNTIPRWKNISPKTSWLYPCHLAKENILQSREVVLTEGISDILSLWEAGIRNVLGIFGTSISSKLLMYIVSLDPERIIISTNNEESGVGNAAAIQIQKKLWKFFTPEKVIIKLPTLKDFGLMSCKDIQDWHNQ